MAGGSSNSLVKEETAEAAEMNSRHQPTPWDVAAVRCVRSVSEFIEELAAAATLVRHTSSVIAATSGAVAIDELRVSAGVSSTVPARTSRQRAG
jgi:hypothetical protein